MLSYQKYSNLRHSLTYECLVYVCEILRKLFVGNENMFRRVKHRVRVSDIFNQNGGGEMNGNVSINNSRISLHKVSLVSRFPGLVIIVFDSQLSLLSDSSFQQWHPVLAAEWLQSVCFLHLNVRVSQPVSLFLFLGSLFYF